MNYDRCLTHILITIAFTSTLLSTTSGKPGNYEQGCGLRSETQQRIVGGQLSYPGRWPWMAALFRTTSSQYCAGALISDRHVLTAAHCVSGVHPSKLHVRLGEFDIIGRLAVNATVPSDYTTTPSVDAENNLFGVDSLIIHEQYEPRSHVNDIAVLRLNKIVKFNPLIQRICLPPPSLPMLEERTAVVAGWGTTAFLGSSSPSLREVTVSIWDNRDCLTAIGKNVFNSTLCAGGKDKSADACQGDSGGPLMMAMADERWAAIGIVSWGIRCGEPNKPGLYTRTSHYTDWILAAVKRS